MRVAKGETVSNKVEKWKGTIGTSEQENRGNRDKMGNGSDKIGNGSKGNDRGEMIGADQCSRHLYT